MALINGETALHKLKNFCRVGNLFVFGVLLLAIRNPDVFKNPIVYAEDGLWTGLGLTNGWSFVFLNARTDYFVFLNIFLLFISTKISLLFSGSPLTLLPASIAVVSFSFYSFIATYSFYVVQRIASFSSAILIYLLILLLPLGISQNEILGRLIQVGFYIPLIATLLFYTRDTEVSSTKKAIIDVLLLICLATNPITIGLLLFFILWKIFTGKKILNVFRSHWFLILSCSIVSIIMVIGASTKGDLESHFISSNFIEAIAARPVLFPLIFPFYDHLNNISTIILIAAWLFLIIAAFVQSKNQQAKKLSLFLFLTMVILNVATIVMRPGLTSILSNYQVTFPDRYFMGTNALVLFLTVLALFQFSESPNVRIIRFQKVLTVLLFANYFFHPSYIFETNHSKLLLHSKLVFKEQICLARKPLKDEIVYLNPPESGRGRRYEPGPDDMIISIYPNPWKMVVPSYLISKAGCKF